MEIVLSKEHCKIIFFLIADHFLSFFYNRKIVSIFAIGKTVAIAEIFLAAYALPKYKETILWFEKY